MTVSCASRGGVKNIFWGSTRVGQFATMGADKAFGRNLEKRLVLPSESWLNFLHVALLRFALVISLVSLD